MPKEIIGADIRVGDVIELNGTMGRIAQKVVRLVPHPDVRDLIWLYTEDNCYAFGANARATLLRREYDEGMDEQKYRKRIVTLMKVIEGIERLGVEEFDSHLREIRTAMDEYELGKPEEKQPSTPVKTEPSKPGVELPKEDPCRMGACKHVKNFAGTCLVWAVEHPIQCDQRRRR
jgi:hypothetical protein